MSGLGFDSRLWTVGAINRNRGSTGTGGSSVVDVIVCVVLSGTVVVSGIGVVVDGGIGVVVAAVVVGIVVVFSDVV